MDLTSPEVDPLPGRVDLAPRRLGVVDPDVGSTRCGGGPVKARAEGCGWRTEGADG